MIGKLPPRVLASGLSVIGSLAGYYLAKQLQKETVPFTLLGGFAGTVLAYQLHEKPQET